MRGMTVVVACLLVGFAVGTASAQSAFSPTSTFGPFVQQGQLPATGLTAISGDTALVAADGIVHVFERDASTDAWTEAVPLTPGDGAAGFGRDVAIDGTRAIVGAEGAAYIFRKRRNGVWHEVAKLVPSGDAPEFGYSVDIDGREAIVGAPGAPGVAYIFRRAPGAQGWAEVATFQAPRGTSFGFDLDISDGAAIVAANTGPRRAVFIFDRDQGGPENWGLVKDLGSFVEFFTGVAIDGDAAVVSTSDPAFYGSYINVFRRDRGGPNAWGREPMYINPDRGVVIGVSLSGDRAAYGFYGGARIIARNQGVLTPPSWNPVIGGPNAWGSVGGLTLAGPPGTVGNTSINGDTVLLALPAGHVEVLVSDVDGDGIRDDRDPCVRDPFNNVAGGCQRASFAYPMLDDLLTQDTVTTETEGRRFVVTATFTNSSETAVKNPFFEVIALTGGNVLINSDAGRGGVGATFSPDVGDGILSPGESMAAEFVIRLRSQQPFEFRVSFRGEPAS